MSKSFNISENQLLKATFNRSKTRDIFNKYTSMIAEFLECAIENIHIHNSMYYIFVIQRGLETLKHCFKMIYLYTKDADVAIFHCKKAFCYYIEFMGQIGEDSHTYLQLNSKDATLFVYKKTIFEIDNEHRKNYTLKTEDKMFLDLISTNIDIFGEIIINILYLTNDVIEKRGQTITKAISESMRICTKLNSKSGNINKKLNESKLAIFFVSTIKDFTSDSFKYSELCGSFIKKYKKKTISKDKICEKLYRNDCDNKLETFTSLRFINWIFS